MIRLWSDRVRAGRVTLPITLAEDMDVIAPTNSPRRREARAPRMLRSAARPGHWARALPVRLVNAR